MTRFNLQFLRPTTAYRQHKTTAPEPCEPSDETVARTLNEFGNVGKNFNRRYGGTVGFGLASEAPPKTAPAAPKELTMPTVSDRLLVPTTASRAQSISQFREAQQQRLYQLMKVGTGATDEQVAALNAQADALEKLGVVTGGNITQTQSQLATFNLQADTIERLTPAILDYVTAEKGANASADEFKQMTNGLAQALNGNFGSLTRVGFVLDDHTKKLISSGTEAEKSAAIVDVLNSTYKGFNAELRNTPEGQMQALRNDFDKLKEDLGKALLPALRTVMNFMTGTLFPALRSFGKLIKDNADAIKMYAIIVGTLVTAFYTYKAALVIVKVAQQLYVVAMTLMKGATLASIASTNGLAASMLMLNAAMRNNPIGIIVTALALLGVAFAIAWKKSETFRGIVIKVVQGILKWVELLLMAWGKFFSLLGKIPGMGWAKKIGDGLDGISKKINTKI